MSEHSELFEAYFDMVEPSSESPFIYHRWTLISAISSLLGRNVYLQFGFEMLYPNMYVCLIGDAGSRKSSAISLARKVLAQSGYKKFARERTSKEKFLADLSSGFDNVSKSKSGEEIEEILDKSMADPDEVLVSAGELEDFLGSGDTGFISLLTNLWDNLDEYSHGKMTGKDIYVNKPTVNLMGGCTPVTFNTVFPPEVIGQGMLSRLLLVYGGGRRCRITFPPPPNPEHWATIVDMLKAISKIRGQFTPSKQALKMFDDIYMSGYSVADARLESYNGRRHNHLYKLCMVIAASNLRTTIEDTDVVYANSILAYAETLMPRALGQFGRSDNSQQTEMVHRLIESAGDTGIQLYKVFPSVSNEFNNERDFFQVVHKLKSAKKVEVVPGTDRIRTVGQQKVVKVPHTDFNLLREYRDSKNKPVNK